MHVAEDGRATRNLSEADQVDGALYQKPRHDQPAPKKTGAGWGEIPAASQGSLVDRATNPDSSTARGYGP